MVEDAGTKVTSAEDIYTPHPRTFSTSPLLFRHRIKAPLSVAHEIVDVFCLSELSIALSNSSFSLSQIPR